MTRRRTERSRAGRALEATLAAGLLAFCGLVAGSSGCTPDPTIASVRSLQGTGAAAFICLGAPSTPSPQRRLGECTHLNEVERSITDFGTDVEVPHLYALLTQSIRGEVALVDLTSEDQNVIDDDPSTPGTNFLQVGAAPTAIVSSPGGTASFVTSAEIGRPAIYALPLDMLRPCSIDDTKCGRAVPTVSSWPACTLPSAPGAMVMVADPAQDGLTRATCGGDYADPSLETGTLGSIDAEGLGRQKLVVALPGLGELVVIDAQAVLDQSPGNIDPCPIETTLTLQGHVEPPDPGPTPGPVAGAACVNPEIEAPGAALDYLPRPSSLVAQDAKLYAGDLAGPAVHVVDAQTPCDLVEIAPFIARSKSDPKRTVVTTDVAVSPRVTSTFKRFLYAIDVDDKSVVVFDASDGSTTRDPLPTPNGTENPLEPDDRIRFTAAPQQLTIISRDTPKAGSDNVAPFGTFCNPDTTIDSCTDTSLACLGKEYRTADDDYASGAGPTTLRGSFALVGLSSGQIGVIDIEDFDEPCRGPRAPDTLGCAAPPENTNATGASDEQTCAAVEPNLPRSANYILSNDTLGRHVPGITSFPLLYDKNGSLVVPGEKPPPQIRATPGATVYVNGLSQQADGDGFLVDDNGVLQGGVALNLDDPRVHTIDQDWSVTFEGALPGFTGKSGNLDLLGLTNGGERQLIDDSAQFCRSGVQSRQAVKEQLEMSGEAPADIEALSRQLADRLTVTNPIADSSNPYWKSGIACTFEQCQGTFGDDTTPTPARDLVIDEAFEGNLDLEQPAVGDDLMKCCFPTLATYEVRPGSQWVVVGVSSGFLHHVVADPVSGACRNSCDPRLARLDGRLRTTPDADDGSISFPFVSPLFSFDVTAPASVTAPTGTCGDGVVSTEPNSTEECDDGNTLPFDGCESDCKFSSTARDMAFKFTTEGSFVPLRVLLTNDDRPAVEIRSLGFLQAIDQIVLTDGALEGVLLVNGTLVGDPKQFF